jgi:hypothetical protein
MHTDEFAMLQRRLREGSQEARQRQPVPARPTQTIPCTELPDDSSDSRAAKNWNFYRREVARLLAEGQEGHWVLISDEKIAGIWPTEEEANRVRLHRFLMQDVLVHQILTREPILRGPTRTWRS